MLELLVWLPPGVVLAVGAVAVYLVYKVPTPARKPTALAAATVLSVALATTGYMEFTIRKIAHETGEPIKGLILHPIPNAGGDHEYTRGGREFEERAFTTPAVVGLVGLLLAAVASSVILLRYRTGYAAVWCAATACALGILIFWLYREFTTWDIFI